MIYTLNVIKDNKVSLPLPTVLSKGGGAQTMEDINMKKLKCCYCGNETKDGKSYHKMCLIDDIYQTIYDNKPLTKTQYCRCQTSGVIVKYIRIDVEEDKKGKVK